MRIAIIHDWLNQIGGAEDVLETLVEMYPSAPVYTSMYAPDIMPPAYRAWDIRVTWMNRLPGIHRHHQPYLPLYPLAFQGLDLRGYDVILSNKSGFCHGVRVPPGATQHVAGSGRQLRGGVRHALYRRLGQRLWRRGRCDKCQCGNVRRHRAWRQELSGSGFRHFRFCYQRPGRPDGDSRHLDLGGYLHEPWRYTYHRGSVRGGHH